MEEKYSKTENPNSQSNNEVIPDVFLSINNTMNSSSNSKLPIIRNSFPLKYIIKPESYKKLEKDRVENIYDLLQTFNERNEDINIDIDNYYDRIKTYVEIDEEVKNLNNILYKLRKH